MKIKDIKVGKWYRTRAGTGQVERVGGTHPPSVRIRIVSPFPRGSVNVPPRDFEEEVPDPPPANPRPARRPCSRA